MKNDWNEINDNMKKMVMEKMEILNQEQAEKESGMFPNWYDAEGKTINEVAFCEAFLDWKPLKCINGTFFGIDGMVPDCEVEKEIYDLIKEVLVKGISNKVKKLLEALKLEAYAEEIPLQTDRIHVANGTYFLNGTFVERKEFCLNRLPVKYNPGASIPERWLKFLSELLEEKDIESLQEFTGYCLIPTNKGQKMMVIIGERGRRKIQSRIGDAKNTGRQYEFQQYSKSRNQPFCQSRFRA